MLICELCLKNIYVFFILSELKIFAMGLYDGSDVKL